MWFIALLIKVISIILLVDFISGVLHWLEDAYGNEDWPIIGAQITKPNIIHHHDPRYFTRYSWLYSARVLLVIGVAILATTYTINQLNWMVFLFVLIGINANEIHKWAHRTKGENGEIITALQRSGLLQSAAHHAVHHRDPKNSHYCVVTNYLNPLLERVQLWTTLESIIFHLFRVQRRPDDSIQRHPSSTPSV